MKLHFRKLTQDTSKFTLEFVSDAVNTISPEHFITLKRPKLDKGKIESIVRSNYAEQISKGLFTHLYIISKEYGFIKWLRSHDRIRDFGPLEQLVNGYGGFQEYENRLMLLSIQDEPIEFLVSILK